MTRSDVVRRVIGVALLCLSGSAVWARLLGWPATLTRILPLVALVCLAYAVGIIGGARVSRGRGALLAVFVTIVGSMLAGAFTLPDTQGREPLQVYTDSLVQWLGTLLGSTVPALVTPDTVTATVIVSAYLTLIACLMVTTGKPALALLPTTLLLVATLAFTQGSKVSAIPFAIAYLVSLGVALSLWPSSKASLTVADGEAFSSVEREPVHDRTRRTVLVIAITAGLSMLALLAATATGLGTIRSAFDPHRTGGYTTDTDVNAVTQATRWQTAERTRKILFTITSDEAPQAIWWSINEGFDGSTWGSAKPYNRVEGPIPYPGVDQASTYSITSKVATTSQLVGSWLPSPYRVTAITSGPYLYNPSGTVAVSGGDSKSLAYTTKSTVVGITDSSQLTNAKPLTREDGYGVLALPGSFPSQLADLASAKMSNGTTPFQQASALADYMSNSGEFSVDNDTVETGLEYPRLVQVMTQDYRGTQAQFATAFALMARSQGLPSRVVAGYRMPGTTGTQTITNNDVLVWAEIGFSGIGWIPFAAAPGDVAAGVPVPRIGPLPKPAPTPSASPSATASPTPTPTPTPTPEPASRPSGVDLRILGAVAVVALLAMWPVFVRFRRSRIRRRLHDPDPDTDVVGAWQWLRAGSAHLGVPQPETISPAGVAADPDTPTQVAVVAGHADQALYSPIPVDADAAKASWRAADSWLRYLRGHGGLRARASWFLLPMDPPDRWSPPDDTSGGGSEDAPQVPAAVGAATAAWAPESTKPN